MSAERFHSQLSAEVPGGWAIKESVTVLANDGQANVIASSEPVERGMTTQDYAKIQGDLLRSEFPAYEEMSFAETALLGGRSGLLRRFRWHPPDGHPVVQMQTYYVDNGRGYTSTATLLASAIEHEATVIEVLRSIRLGG